MGEVKTMSLDRTISTVDNIIETHNLAGTPLILFTSIQHFLKQHEKMFGDQLKEIITCLSEQAEQGNEGDQE